VLRAPSHPYTRGLLDSLPMRGAPGHELAQIPGSTPSPLRLPEGCAFRPRCSRATDRCLVQPPLEQTGVRAHRCHHPLPAEIAA
jgi:peptide/nickel transport system ATP-binding protein